MTRVLAAAAAMTCAAVTLAAATAAGGATHGAGTPGAAHVRPFEGVSAKPHMSVRARDLPRARPSAGPPREVPNMLGRRSAAPPSGSASGTDSIAPAPASRNLAAPLLASSAGGVDVDGIASTDTANWEPPDSNGDVGPLDYVQIVNMNWEVFDKSGQSIGGPFELNALWSKQPPDDPCQATPQGDPIVQYDQIEDRWLLSYFAWGTDLSSNATSPYYQCMAVSTTGDPLGTWWLYDFDITGITKIPDGATAGFPDYPKFGIWSDGYYMSANLFWPEPDFNNAFAMAVTFEKQAMMDGQYARFRGFVVTDNTYTYGGMLPADYVGDAADAPSVNTPDPMIAPASGDVPNTTYGDAPGVQIYQFSGNWSGDYMLPTYRYVSVAPYDTDVCGDFPLDRCIPQPGTAVKLPARAFDQFMYPASYRKVGSHESLVFNKVVDVGSSRAAIRWYELRGVTSASPTVYAEGTIDRPVSGGAADAVHRWTGASSIDQAGNIGVGYNVSDATSVYPGLRYAGRTGSNATTGSNAPFDVDEATLVAGGGHKTGVFSSGSARWGDYSSMSVDPVDGCTFWFTGEYIAADTDFGWNTRIGNFRIPSGACGSVNQQPIASFTVPSSTSPNTPISFDGSASSDPDGSISSYRWDFDSDGTPETTGDGAPGTVMHSYSLPGTYTATLEVTDDAGAVSSTSREITVTAPGGFHPANDPRTGATAITAGAKVQTTNVGATEEAGEVLSCSSRNYVKTVWLTFHAATAGTLDLRTGGLDTVMSLYHGADAAPLTCNDDDAQAAPGPSHINRRVTAGDYAIQIGSFDSGGSTVSGVITVTADFAPNAAPTAAFSATPDPAPVGHAVTFDATGSSDSDGNVAKYEWDLDGNGSFETDSGTTKTASNTYGSAATVNVGLRVTDDEGATGTVTHPLTVIAPSPPTAKLSFSPNPALAGRTVTFDGSGSADVLHTITRYEWDLDGNGVFERDTGTTATTTNSYSAPGTYTVALRVTDSDSGQSTTSGDLTITAPPDNNTLFGVTINNEATYTRTPKVVLNLKFPTGVTGILVSNDGGFLHPQTFEPKKQIDWELVSTGPERLPKTVYVRFVTGPFIGQQYTDDIILDEIPPVVSKAAVSPAGGSAARAAKLRKWTVKIKATDSNSGVAGVQVTANKKKPGKLLAYKKKLTVKSAKRPKFVRAQDKAGNISGWKKAR